MFDLNDCDDEMNNNFMTPPLGHKEVAGIVKAVMKKN